MKLASLATAALPCLLLAACTDGPPLSRSMIDVWVYADPSATPATLQVSLDVIDQLDSFSDAVSAGAIDVTLDGRPLVLDPATGFSQQGGSYRALFDVPAGANLLGAPRETPGPATPTLSTILITDGTITWHAQFAGLFTNDLAPVTQLVAGANTFEWPSATLTNDGIPEIQSACLEVVGRSSHCASYGDGNPNGISQQYVTLPSDAAPGDTVIVTATRWDDAPDSGATQFIAQTKNRYVTTQR